MGEEDVFGLPKVVKDMYFGNGKPGLITRIQLAEDAVDRIEETLAKLAPNIAEFNSIVQQFKGGAAVAKHGMSAANIIVSGLWAVLGLLLGHLWK